ncbi:MAG TPA: glycoside hydrolase family 16 protein [Polyangiales bacterium]
MAVRTIGRAWIAWVGLSLLSMACGEDAPDEDLAQEAGTQDASIVIQSESDAAAKREDAGRQDAGGTVIDGGMDAGARAGWRLVWQDEFEGAEGSSPSASRWVFETGGNGFGNDELEYYTARPENAALDGDGKLVITARAESYMGRSYTSARLKTQGTFATTYGRFEARLKLPVGQGMWPAFWMLGANLGAAQWPDCGEIDIMENIGKEPALVHGTLHGPGYSGSNGIGKSYALPDRAQFSADFHVYAVEWEAHEIRWYVDDTLYQTRKPADLPAGKKWVFDHDFFVLLNLAVGGQWPGNPDANSKFPQTLSADYVRVYARE